MLASALKSLDFLHTTIFVKTKWVKQMLFNASMELMLYNLELYNSIAVVIRSLFLKVLTSVAHFPLNMNKTLG